ncbi:MULTISPECIES: hypothetical protein [Pyrobaculum]|uniref:hypothetical protein n=2 Tax=Thermoproteaceae TaxID=2267 RepID=UPI002275212C|nr:hypothetical protein [Pyrobaculum arsenaticum]
MKASNYPKYIVVREATGITLDPVNIIFEIDMEEIAAVLSRDGWQQAYIENPAYLEDRKPLATYEKRIVGMVVRYHMRLWLFDVGDVYIGNAHLDMPWLTGHRSYHNVGRDYVAKLFLDAGYAVETTFLDNVIRDHDGWAAKIYKKIDK